MSGGRTCSWADGRVAPRMLLALGATELVRRWLDLADGRAVAHALFAGDALRIGSVVLFGLAGDFSVALAAFWAAPVFRRMNQPVYLAWLNQQLESRSRARVLPLSGQIDALGQIVGGPTVGAVGDASLRTAIVVSGASLASALRYTGAIRQRAPAASEAEGLRSLVPGL